MNNVLEKLREAHVEFQLFEHPAVFTVEEADQHWGDIPGGKSKNLFLRNRKGDTHYLVVVESNKRVDVKQLAERLQVTGGLSFASPERMMKCLGLTPGSVSLLGLLNDIERKVRVVVDEDLLEYDYLSCHPNVNTATVVLKREDLLGFIEGLGYEVRVIKF